MKLPDLSALRKRGGSDGGPPQMLTDLYQDLRDKHLLPVVILLVVGIAAIPVVLGGGSPSEPAAPSASAAQLSSELALQAEPAVLIESSGVRDYRERLRVFQEKNPFRQQLTGTAKKAGGSQGADVTETLSTLDTSGGGSTITSTGVSSGGSGSLGIPTPGVGDGTTTTGGSGGGGAGGGGTQVETKYFEYRVDIEFNALSQKKKLRKGVKTLTLLPSEDRPVISFLGATEGGKEAVFLVSPDAGVQGGKCVPSPESCFFLTLGTKADDNTAFIDYTDPATSDNTTYRLALKRIKRVAIKP